MDRGWHLVVLRDERILQVIPLDRPESTVGRGAANRIRLEDDAVQERHCRLSWEDDLVRVDPLDGTVMTSSGGPATRLLLDAGDDVLIGPFRLQVVVGPVEIDG